MVAMSAEPARPATHALRDAAADLLLGATCVGCGRRGRMLCPPCRALLPRAGRPAWPTPVPPGLVPPFAAGEYDGALRAMVVGHKDRAQLRWRRDLGRLLSLAVEAAVAGVPQDVPVLLVPVPSRPGSGRRRGHDPTWRLVERAATELAARRPTHAARLLVSRGGTADQRGLGSLARAANLAGSMACPSRGLARLGRRRTHWHVVVCDDVITTGSSAREAQRALTAVGLPPLAVATVAATRLRRGNRGRPLETSPARG